MIQWLAFFQTFHSVPTDASSQVGETENVVEFHRYDNSSKEKVSLIFYFPIMSKY